MRVLLILLILSTPSFAKPLVVASFSILGNMIQEIGQDKVDVKTLVGPNQDSHIYEPRPQDGKELAKADLVIVNGLGFEGWLDRLIEASGYKGNVLIATTGITPLTQVSRGVTFTDPHAWHSLKNAAIYVDNIVRGLSLLLPKEASFFQAQGKAYKKALHDLEIEILKKLKPISSEWRKVLTSHAAFGYLGREFGITFYSPIGMNTDAEPSAKAIANLIRKCQKEKIQAVFIENIANSQLIEQIAQEAGIKVGGILYSDALSLPGTEADTYLKMMRFNLTSLTKAMERKETDI
jgi:zinc/manganese transport system substrate-binding protein